MAGEKGRIETLAYIEKTEAELSHDISPLKIYNPSLNKPDDDKIAVSTGEKACEESQTGDLV